MNSIDLDHLDLSLPPQLPVSEHAAELIRSVQQHPVNIVCGATGSGKSTQLPKLCLLAGRARIAHTQPRRLAARTLAQRLAVEVGCEVGADVGWQVRFAQALSDATRIKLMTDGILLSELRHDPTLSQYDTIIIDEAHERSLNIDFLLGCLHRLVRQRPDLRLIITSATLDADKFSRHFDGAPVHEVEGRSYPVELRYRECDDTLGPAVAEAIAELWREGPGGALVFLPGEREIREVRETLSRHPAMARYPDLEILPLYARLPASHQQRIFSDRGTARRIVLATNVAETSLTVPGIRYVVDSGLARIARFSPRTQLQSLGIEAIAQDACAQRAGRCGRTAPGICVRLFSEQDFAGREPETAPEILRSNLADVVLQMADRRLGEPEQFPFVDAPETRRLRDARRLLLQLQALREDGRLTKIGRKMARLPVEPRFSRMLVEAGQLGCLHDAVVVVAALSMQDVRESPPDQREAARQAQAPFRDADSDFAGLLKLYAAIREQRSEHGSSAFSKWCRQHFLNPRRVREWQDLCRQLLRDLRGAGYTTQDHNPKLLHRALLCGLLDHIGQHHDKGEFRGPRGLRWHIHPESALRRSQASWVFAASIVSTGRTLARQVAKTDSRTIIAAAGPLLRREAIEPAWDPKRGQVMCREQCRLFGLEIDSQRQRPLYHYDPDSAREIFILEALVAGRWGEREAPPFLSHNRRLVSNIRRDEERLRRRDLLRSDDKLAGLYAAQIPAEVCGRDQLLGWLRENDDGPLRWTAEQIRNRPADRLDSAWPSKLKIHGQTLRLRYRFAPGDAADGVSVELPLEALSQLQTADFSGQVPGLAEQQLEALLRGLPKADRKQLIPLADTIAALQEDISAGADFLPQLRRRLETKLGHPVAADILNLDQLPDRLRLRYVLRSAEGRQAAASRDLETLRNLHGAAAKKAAQEALPSTELARGLQRFPEPTPRWLQRSASGTPLRLILSDQGTGVDVSLCADPHQAEAQHEAGLRRLAWLRLKSRLTLAQKSLKPLRGLRQLAPPPEARWQAVLGYLGARDKPAPLAEELGLCALGAQGSLAHFDGDRVAFEQQVESLWPAIQAWLQEASKALLAADDIWPPLRLQLAVMQDAAPLQRAAALLMHPAFIATTPSWTHWPRYLQALAQRLEKRRRNPGADHDREQMLASFENRLLDFIAGQPGPEHRATVSDIFWALQDYRVSLFAQELGVPNPVSPKRLNKLFLQIQA